MINEILDFFKTVFSGSGFFSLGCNVWNSLIAYAFDMLQTNPKSLADGELWDEAYRIFLALQILGATLVSVFFMINFFKETTDIKHGMTMEASIQFFIKLALVDAVFLNLTNILVFLIEIEQAFFGIIVPEDAASLVIRVGDDWEMSGSGLIFGNLFGLVFLFICLGGAVITLWTVYRVFLKLFFYMAVGSGVYDTRKDAGNAIIKFFQTDADGTAKIGTYLGFSMNIAFDSFNRKFVLRLSENGFPKIF